ncbi:MAG: DUF4279 domain-containing protein [Acidobacteriota bacterium]|nr:DUF4279 domain-containing protein [Acidobacteriota bacterium]
MARVTTWLFVESECASVEEISHIIGLECDTSRRRGDVLVGRPGKISRTSLWRLDNRTETSDDPEKILSQIVAGLKDILARISGHEQGFVSATAMGDSGLLVGVLASGVPPIIFDAALLKAIANLNVDLEVDLAIG